MGWATHAIEELIKKKTVKITPHGNSMSGKIESGDTVTLVPCDPKDLEAGDIVLTKVRGTVYLHLIKAIKGDMVLIGNNKGKINGWTSHKNVYGKVTEIQ